MLPLHTFFSWKFWIRADSIQVSKREQFPLAQHWFENPGYIINEHATVAVLTPSGYIIMFSWNQIDPCESIRFLLYLYFYGFIFSRLSLRIASRSFFRLAVSFCCCSNVNVELSPKYSCCTENACFFQPRNLGFRQLIELYKAWAWRLKVCNMELACI